MAVLSTSQMPALQVQAPDLRIAENYEAGVNARINQTTAQMQQQAQQIEMLASGAAYSMPNGPNGDVDPVKWNEVLDSYEASGMPPDKVAAFRDRPELAKVLLHSSSAALAAANDQQMFPLKLKEMEAQIAQTIAASQPKAPTPTDDQREYQMAVEQGFKGSFVDYKKALQSPGTVVNVSPDGSQGGASAGQFQKDLGGIMAKDYDTIRQDAKAARTGLATLGVMEKAIADDSFYSGFGAEQLLTLKQLGASLGIDPDGVSSMETFNALNKQAALASMGGSLGAGFSNADRDFVTGQVPSLTNTPEGNRQLIEVQRKIAERKIDIAKLATAYVKKNGVLDAGFEEEMQQFAEANPLFTEDNAALDAPSSGEPDLTNVPDGAIDAKVVDGKTYFTMDGEDWYPADAE